MTDRLPDEVIDAARRYRWADDVPRDEIWRSVEQAQGRVPGSVNARASRTLGAFGLRRIAVAILVLALGAGAAFALDIAIQHGGWSHPQHPALTQPPIHLKPPIDSAASEPPAPPATIADTQPPGQIGDTVIKIVTALHPGGGSLALELSIGASDGPPEYLFHTVNDIAADKDGSAWVLDHGGARAMGPPVLRQYSATGKYLRNAGSSGKGEGQFRFPGKIGRLPDGGVVVWDEHSRQINIFDRNGQPTSTWAVGDTKTTVGPITFVVGTDGTLDLGWVPNFRAVSRGGYVDGPRLIRFSSTGVALDTMPRPDPIPNAAIPPILLGPTLAGEAGLQLPVAHSPRSLLVWNPLGFWITGLSNHYAIELRIPPRNASNTAQTWHAGDPIISVRRDLPPVRIEPAEHDEDEAQLTANIDRLQPPRVVLGTRTPIPTVKPAWTGITAAPDGRIWIKVSMPSVRYDPSPADTPVGLPPIHWRDPAAYDVFEPDGTLLGRVSVPDDIRVMTMLGDVVWAVKTESTGMQTVNRFRITWK